MAESRILVAIFHLPGKDNENFEQLKSLLGAFDIYVPSSNFYGAKWNETKSFFVDREYDALFVICSDVQVIKGDIVAKIREYATNKNVGCFSFGTIGKFTFDWLAFRPHEFFKAVPLVEGYCFGVNKLLMPLSQVRCKYGYGIDVELGMCAYRNGLLCLVDNTVCLEHAFGKSYSDEVACDEFHDTFSVYPDLLHFWESLRLPIPLPRKIQENPKIHA